MKSKTLRLVAVLAVAGIITLGFFTTWGVGTLSAPGIAELSLLCPLGALTTMLASKMLVPRALISLALMVLAIVIFARAFCAWVCPVPLVSKIRGLFARRPAAGTADSTSAGKGSLAPADSACSSASSCKGGCSTCASKRGAVPDARHFVLGGSLLTAAIFGFPVFCLICPIGLTFATIFLVVRLFTDGDVTLTLLLVPALLAAEVIFFRKWCSKLCPLSAFMSLIGKANRTFVPTIDDKVCLETSKHVACGACGKACPEGIDPRHPQLSSAAWSECSKCRECVDACPVNAITMPLLPRKTKPTEDQVPTEKRAQ